MTMTTTDLLRGNLDAVADQLATIWAAIDTGAWPCLNCGEHEDDHDDRPYLAPEDALTHDDPTDALHALPLEIVWEAGEPFVVVLATGGPNIEITGGGRAGGYVLSGYWAGTTCTLTGEAITRTGAYFRDLSREVAA